MILHVRARMSPMGGKWDTVVSALLVASSLGIEKKYGWGTSFLIGAFNRSLVWASFQFDEKD